MLRVGSVAGGLFVLVAHALQERGDTAAIHEAFLAQNSDLQRQRGMLLLAARVMLSPFFLLGVTSALSPSTGSKRYSPIHAKDALLTIAVSFAGAVALLLGARSGFAAVVLGTLLIVFNLSAHLGMMVSNDNFCFFFFQDLSILGGLFLLALEGPGTMSLDNTKKDL